MYDPEYNYEVLLIRCNSYQDNDLIKDWTFGKNDGTYTGVTFGGLELNKIYYIRLYHNTLFGKDDYISLDVTHTI